MVITVNVPSTENILIKQGQKIDFGTPLFQDVSIQETVIPVARKLHVSPSKIFLYLRKFVGDSVGKGEIVASKKGIFSAKNVMSDILGVIQEIDHNAGTLVVKSTIKNGGTQTSYFKGEIMDIEKLSIRIKVHSGKEFTAKKVNNNFGGEAFYFKNQSLVELREDEVADNILVTESVSSYLQTKTEALDIQGFVTLRNPPENTALPVAQMKNINEFEEAIKLKFAYCLADKKSGKIYFYE